MERPPSILKDHVLPVTPAPEFFCVSLLPFEGARGFSMTGKLTLYYQIQMMPLICHVSLESSCGLPERELPLPFSDEQTCQTLVENPLSSLLG